MSPMILKLTKYTDPVWKSKFKNIPTITPEIKNLVRDMRETLEITSGVGLAAPQINHPLRLFIIDYGKLKETFINPRIVRLGKETDEVEEGCLSVPCKRGLVTRPTEIEIEYLDLKGEKKKMILRGYFARIVQHEYDHLSSTFYINRILDKKKIYAYKSIKVVYFSSSEFGLTVLRTLYGQQLVGEIKINLVVTNPDKPAGRGKEVRVSPIKNAANEFHLPVSTPASLKQNRELIKELKAASPDFLVVASYGHIIPKAILRIPKKGSLNVHPSLLPKYRGASPIQAAILNGDSSTGVTIMKMNEKMDEGDIMASVRMKISAKDTRVSLSAKLSSIGANLILHVLHLVNINKIKSKPQDSTKATYTKILTKEDGYFDHQNPPGNLQNMIRAYYPWPGVWTYYQTADSSKQKAGKKVLKLLPEKMVQLEGKEPVGVEEFKQGHQDFGLDW